MMTRLYSYVCALHVYVYSSTYCKDSGYTCDCYFLCSSEHFAKVHFATISITFVKATGQSNKLLRLASCVSLYVTVCLSLSFSLPVSLSLFVSHTQSVCLSFSLSLSLSLTQSLCLSLSVSVCLVSLCLSLSPSLISF